MRTLPASEVAGSAAASITRFERILRNLGKKRADVPVVDAFISDASHIFFSRHRRTRQKNVRSKNFHRISFSKICQAELQQRYTTNI
jgi:hypothetical protein